MATRADRFYIGKVPIFLGVVKLMTQDKEFRIAFDFANKVLEMESMMMGGVVAAGVQLPQAPGGVLVPSPVTRSDRVTLRVDGGSLVRAMVALGRCKYAYISITVAEESEIHLEAFGSTHETLGSAKIDSLTLEEHDTEFPVAQNTLGASLEYPVEVTYSASVWKNYFPAGKQGLTVRYAHARQHLAVETRDTLTRVSLLLKLPKKVHHAEDVSATLVPAVVAIVRNVLIVPDAPLTLLLHPQLPIQLHLDLGVGEGCVRMYAGTKEED